MAHTITHSAAGLYLQTQGDANHAQATWVCPSTLIHFCAACPSSSLFCLTRAPETRYQHPSLPRMSLPISPPPGFFHSCWTLIPSPRNREPTSDPDVPTTPFPAALPAHVFAIFAKTQDRPLVLQLSMHTSPKTIHHAFCASTGSPSSATSNSSTNYLFFTFETLQSPALPYLSVIIQCWAIDPYFCFNYTRLPCQLV